MQLAGRWSWSTIFLQLLVLSTSCSWLPAGHPLRTALLDRFPEDSVEPRARMREEVALGLAVPVSDVSRTSHPRLFPSPPILGADQAGTAWGWWLDPQVRHASLKPWLKVWCHLVQAVLLALVHHHSTDERTVEIWTSRG